MESLAQHFKNVYCCLPICTLLALLASSIGTFFNNQLGIAILATGGSTLFFLLLLIIPDIAEKNRTLRLCFLLSFAGFTGMGLVNLLRCITKNEFHLFISAILETTLIFSALSACAILSERGRWLFLGMPLSVLMFTLIIISFANVIDESRAVSRATIYLSLFAIFGLVLYDTQMIIEKFKEGDADFIGHSMNIFTDFIGIYRRLLNIGINNELTDSSEEAEVEEETDFYSVFSRPLTPMNALL